MRTHVESGLSFLRYYCFSLIFTDYGNLNMLADSLPLHHVTHHTKMS
uniref:Uncharacterized protein n=1 Tax=Arundo donax TaxID=35708 RepID=A0A0A8YF44_ARUDO